MSKTSTKRCTKCGDEQPATLEYFGKHNETKDGLYPSCRKCARNRATTENRKRGHKPRISMQSPVGMRRCSKCLNDYPSNLAHFYKAKGGLSAWCKSCYNEETKRYQSANPEKKKKYNKTHYYRFPHKQTEKRLRRRTLEHSLPHVFTDDQWQRALDYFNGCCAVCGRQANDLFGTHTIAPDHWIPLAFPSCPGTIATNIVPLCHGQSGCNNSKGAKLPGQWLTENFSHRKVLDVMARIEAYFDHVKPNRAEFEETLSQYNHRSLKRGGIETIHDLVKRIDYALTGYGFDALDDNQYLAVLNTLTDRGVTTTRHHEAILSTLDAVMHMHT
jgi:hypothetical protein